MDAKSANANANTVEKAEIMKRDMTMGAKQAADCSKYSN